MNQWVSSNGISGVPASIVSLLQHKAASQPDHIIYTFMQDSAPVDPVMTYGKLDQAARQIGGRLQEMGAAGQRALLLYPPGLDYISGFFGCLYAGVIAVPAYPPDPARLDQMLPKILAIAGDAQASLALTTTPVVQLVERLLPTYPQLAGLRWVATDSLATDTTDPWKAWEPDAGALAYLQYTSGSTRQPKGVCISHANLVANTLAIAQTFDMHREDVLVLWLPMYHNMGLVGGVLQPFFTGCSCYLMSPLAFLQQPVRWLAAISKYHGTVAGGPNFGFDLCAQRVTPEQKQGLDLRYWVLAFNGAEPVRPETLDRFSKAFAECGFRREAFFPCYGLAESTLMVTGGQRGAGPVISTLDRKALNNHQVIATPAGSPGAVRMVGCGKTFAGQELLIVDPETRQPCSADQVGELWIAGPSVAQGYWNLPGETAQTFQGFLASGQGPYLRTGDLAFLHDGECAITGRLKDLIIIRGQNHYPQDIEVSLLACHPALAPNGGAAFSIEVDGEERLAVVQEVDPQRVGDLEGLAHAVRQKVYEDHELQLYAVVFVEPGRVPKTQSGKVQRQPTRRAYLAGDLQPLYEHRLGLPRAEAQEASEPASKGNLLHTALLALGPEKGQELLIAHMRTRLVEVLHLPPADFDVDKPLTSMGLDSILAIDLAEEVESTLNIPLPMAKLLQGASLAELAVFLLGQLFQAKEAPTPPVAATTAATFGEADEEAAGRMAEYPLSHGQQALWFVQRLVPESIAHNIVYAVRILSELNIPALRRSFEQVVARHAMLRTTFSDVNGQPVQRVNPRPEFEYQVEDASTQTAQAVEERLAREAQRPFDLERGPLLRVLLLRRAEKDVILLLSMHHIVTDLWSMAVLMYEIGQLYAAETGGSLANLRPVLPDAYPQEARRQLEMLAGAEGKAHWAYWRERLSGELPAVHLPTDHPRPDVQYGRGGARSVCLEPALTQALRELSRAQSTNLYTLLLAAFDVLLSRYTGETDLLVGTPKSGRNRQNAGVIGYFINPVVIRADLSGDPTFTGLLQRLIPRVRADFEHDAYPFPLLVERLRPARDAGRGALFQVLFSWQKTTQIVDSRSIAAFALGEEHVTLQLGGLTVETLPLAQRVTPTDLALLVAEREDELGMTIEYSTDLFDATTIERMLQQMKTLLGEVVKDPERPISSLALIDPDEARRLLDDWAAPHTVQQADRPVHERIEEQARLTPQADALAFAGKKMSYAEVDRRAEAVAQRLRAAGAAPGQPVGACLERSFESVLALLGILKAGGVYLPLDPDNPDERLTWMIRDAGARMVVTHSSLAGRLQGSGARLIAVDEDPLEAAPPASEAKPALVSLEQPAYLIYTSGSTGQPKGVLVTHRAIANHIQFTRGYYQMTPADRVLQFASANFDASLEQIFTTLASGAGLYLRDVELWDPEDFPAKLAAWRLTVINLPPAYWQQWVGSTSFKAKPADDLALRLVILGGDVVPLEALAAWQASAWRGVRLINAYGPTEATITATAYDVPAERDARSYPRLPIGRPLAGRRAYVLSASAQLAPVGVPAELHLGGVSIADGYLNRPELTAEKFIHDPFSAEPGARMYKTGDLARWLPDGNLEFLGRIDRQVKIRGIRVEPEEVEVKLRGLAGVREAAVLPVQGETGTVLAGFVVAQAENGSDTAALADELARQLPAALRPAVLVAVDALPYTLGGKLDQEKLISKARQAMAGARQNYTAPRDAVEARLVCIWEELLGVEQIGVQDSFFSLGGHSLLATQLVSRLRGEYGVELSLQQMFEQPTVAGLAVLVAQSMAGQTSAADLENLLNEIESLPDEPPAGQARADEALL